MLQQPVKNTNLVARGTLNVGPHQLYAELTGAQVETNKSFSPSQLTSSTSEPTMIRSRTKAGRLRSRGSMAFSRAR